MRPYRKHTLTLTLVVAAFLAACSSTTRVLVYNIHAGKDAGGVDNLQRVADLVRSTRADVVLLQEVDRKTRRSSNVDHLAELMRLTGMNGAFGKSLDYQGGDYGIAILSRWPFDAQETVPLRTEPPQPRSGGSVEPRVALLAETGGIRIINTHIDASREDTWRLQEIESLIPIAKRAYQGPVIAGGDLNSEPDSEVQRRLRAAGFVDCDSGADLTYPANVPVKRIDYLYMIQGTRCVSARVLDSQASDHRAVLFEVTLRRRR
jgi:endonuclease/exonuclease/phosphatase family metal-dependent hydrolase